MLSQQSTIASYIRLFEPLVIKALKQYTVSSSLDLQQQVLDLLSQLIQLRVNYCLLDSDQVFIGFIIKQLEFIEEGQIRLNIRKLFVFINQLCKFLYYVQKNMQRCDFSMTTIWFLKLTVYVHEFWLFETYSLMKSNQKPPLFMIPQ